jgi:hypothetical protein
MDINTLKEYIKIHIISLEQDLDEVYERTQDYISDDDHDDIVSIEAKQAVLYHILAVIDEQ